MAMKMKSVETTTIEDIDDLEDITRSLSALINDYGRYEELDADYLGDIRDTFERRIDELMDEPDTRDDYERDYESSLRWRNAG